MFRNAANIKNMQSVTAQYIDSGDFNIYLQSVEKKRVYIHSINGFSDAKSEIKIYNSLSGSIDVSSGSYTVDGNSTKFLTELSVNDLVLIEDTNELFRVDSILDDKTLMATTPINNGFEGSQARRIIAMYYTVPQEPFNFYVNGSLWSSIGKKINISMTVDSTGSITVTGFNT